ncbi:MAG TPA: hypothetical protein VGE52_20200 [Pirellulales bacterium]
MIRPFRILRRAALGVVIAAALGWGLVGEALAGWIVLFGKNGYEASEDLPDDVKQALVKIKRGGKEIRCVAFTPSGGWAILYGKNSATTSRIPENAEKALAKFAKAGSTIRSIAFGDRDSWAIVYDENSYSTHNANADLEKKLAEVLNKNHPITSLTMASEDKWALTFNYDSYRTWNASPDLNRVLDNILAQKGRYRYVAYAPKNGWVVLHGVNDVTMSGLPDDAASAIQGVAKKGLHSVVFFQPPGMGESTSTPPADPAAPGSPPVFELPK